MQIQSGLQHFVLYKKVSAIENVREVPLYNCPAYLSHKCPTSTAPPFYATLIKIKCPTHSHIPIIFNLSLVPRPRGRRESGLVSTVCACASDSGNLLRTSPIMDKLHVVVMRRNNQTRYTACSVAACVYAAMASITRYTRGDTTRTTLQLPPVLPSLCL